MDVIYLNPNRQGPKAYLDWGDPCHAYVPDTPLYRDKIYMELTLQHFECLHHIRYLYQFLTFDNYDLFLDYCYLDLSLAPKMRAVEYFYEVTFDSFETYKFLALALERKKRYEEAITACEQAISLGYYNDDTKGKMQGRIQRLQKKINKN